ncbi:MAG: hypothetical protein AABZ53_06885 [Planctomycetota bacterium]
MKRRLLSAAALLALAGLIGGCSGPSRVRSYSSSEEGRTPAYLSMSAGDRAGRVMLENRIFTARTNVENAQFATVLQEIEAGE